MGNLGAAARHRVRRTLNAASSVASQSASTTTIASGDL